MNHKRFTGLNNFWNGHSENLSSAEFEADALLEAPDRADVIVYLQQELDGRCHETAVASPDSIFFGFESVGSAVKQFLASELAKKANSSKRLFVDRIVEPESRLLCAALFERQRRPVSIYIVVVAVTNVVKVHVQRELAVETIRDCKLRVIRESVGANIESCVRVVRSRRNTKVIRQGDISASCLVLVQPDCAGNNCVAYPVASGKSISSDLQPVDS